MPDIIGPRKHISSHLDAIDVHCLALEHLANRKICLDILRARHGLNLADSKSTAPLISSHVTQALNFHKQCAGTPLRIRPILQYYSYLNLAVAAILAYRPTNFEGYKMHGVEDLSHKIDKLQLGSLVLKVKRGAVPLFHSILSSDPLDQAAYRFGHILAGTNTVTAELTNYFDKKCDSFIIKEGVSEEGGKWHSWFSFNRIEGFVYTAHQNPGKNRLIAAIPLLSEKYYVDSVKKNSIIFHSNQKWTTENKAVPTKNLYSLIHLTFP